MDSEGWYFRSETRLKQLKRLSKYLAPCWQFNQWCWQLAKRDWGSKGRRSYRGKGGEVRFQFTTFRLQHKKEVGVATYFADSSHKSLQEGLCLLVQLFRIGLRERFTKSIDVTVLCDQGNFLQLQFLNTAFSCDVITFEITNENRKQAPCWCTSMVIFTKRVIQLLIYVLNQAKYHCYAS